MSYSSDVGDLRKGDWRLECLDISLSNGDEERPVEYSGPGEIRTTSDGGLELVLYDRLTENDPKDLFEFPPPGSWTTSSDLFELRAVDLVGKEWRASNVRPDTSATIGRPGTVVRADLHQVTSESHAKHDSPDWLSIEFFQDIKVPANVATVVRMSEGDTEWIGGVHRNVWRFSCGDDELELRRAEWGFRLSLRGPSTLGLGIDTRVEEAVWFTLGQPLTADVIHYCRGPIEGIQINRRDGRSALRAAQCMLRVDYPEDQAHLAEMFCRYLRFASTEKRERYHPLSVHVKRMLRASEGTVEKSALAMSVAVEGVLGLGFPAYGAPEEDTVRAIDNLEDSLKASLENSPLRPRVEGFIRAMRRPSPRSALSQLMDEGTITEDQVAAWERLRHPQAHGKEYGLPFREVYELMLRVRVLMALLIFRIIGYEGTYRDFGTKGWPIRQVEVPSVTENGSTE